MSAVELDSLERDVEEARLRVARDLARVREPGNFAEFKDALVAEARDAKDSLIERAKTTTMDEAQRIWIEVRNRALANPAAVLAIGAGLAWRLYRRPPITTALIGLGAYYLLRGPAPDPARIEEDNPVHRAGEIASKAQQKMGEWSGQVVGTARETAATLAEQTASAAAVTRDALSSAASQASDAMSRAATQATSAVRSLTPTPEQRDSYLLGLAALAVGGAVGLSLARSRRQANADVAWRDEAGERELERVED